jgi:hypothetical protein
MLMAQYSSHLEPKWNDFFAELSDATESLFDQSHCLLPTTAFGTGCSGGWADINHSPGL